MSSPAALLLWRSSRRALPGRPPRSPWGSTGMRSKSSSPRQGRYASALRETIGEEAGVGLIEIMLAMTLMSIVLLALGSLMFQAGRDMNRNGAVAYRSAADLAAVSWAQSLPFDSLTSATYQSNVVGCVTDTTGLLIYHRCTTVQVLTGKQT